MENLQHDFYKKYLTKLREDVLTFEIRKKGFNLFPAERHIDLGFVNKYVDKSGFPVPYEQTGDKCDPQKNILDWKKCLIKWLELIGREDLTAKVWQDLNGTW